MQGFPGEIVKEGIDAISLVHDPNEPFSKGLILDPGNAGVRSKVMVRFSFLSIFLLVNLFFLAMPTNLLWAETFKVRLENDTLSLDYTKGEVNHEIVTNWMQGLFVSDAQGKVMPGDAKSAQFANQNKTLIVNLRDAISWNDGVRICAEHYVNAFKRLQDPQFASPYVHYASNFKSYEAKGCKKLIIHFYKPMPEAMALLAHYVFYPIRKDILIKNPKQFLTGKSLVSNGPYLIESWLPNNRVVLTWNKRYFSDHNLKKPTITRIEFFFIKNDFTAIQLYKKNQLDWVKGIDKKIRKEWKSKKDFRIFPTLTVFYLGINVTPNNRLTDPKFRQRLFHSLDRSQLTSILGQEVEGVSRWVPTELLQLATSRNMKSKPYPLLKNDTVEAKKSEAKIKLRLFVYAKGTHLTLAQWIKAQWEQKNSVQVQISVLDESIYWNRLIHDPPEIFLSGVTAPYFDSKAFLKEFYRHGSANWTSFRSQEYDRLAYSDPQAAQMLLLESGYVIPLYRRGVASLVKPFWQNFMINPLDRVQIWRITK